MATVSPTGQLVTGARAARSTIALKLLMAATGIVFIAYVLVHMYGMLKAFGGHDGYVEYAHHLREIGEPVLPHGGFLWVMRVALATALVVHVAAAVALWRRASTARSSRYVVKRNRHSTLSSRTMRWGGLALLLFVIWHLVHFTVPKVNVQGGGTDDPYYLLVESFEVWWLTLIYLLAMAALAMHIRHGVWSAAQTLGLTNNLRARRNSNILGVLLATVIAGGFSLVPIFVLAGVID